MISLLSGAGKQIGKPLSACAGCSDSPPQLTFFLCVLNRVWLCEPVDYSPPGSSVHGISQGRITEAGSISSPRGSSPPRDQHPVSCISCIGRWILYHWCHLGSLYWKTSWETFVWRRCWRGVCVLSASVGFQSEPSCALQPGNQNYWLSASFCLTIRKL